MKSTKDHLLGLGDETLAKALLDGMNRDESAADVVSRLRFKPSPKSGHWFHHRLRALGGSKNEFIRGSAARALATETDGRELQIKVTDPREGCTLVSDFFRNDGNIFEHCDDSSGYIGDVFRHEANDLFDSYASRCLD